MYYLKKVFIVFGRKLGSSDWVGPNERKLKEKKKQNKTNQGKRRGQINEKKRKVEKERN